METMVYKLLTFDVTNTLLKLKVKPGNFYAKIASKYGFTADPNELTKAFKRQWKILTVDEPNFGAVSGLGYVKWWEKMVERTFLDCGYQIDKNKLNKTSEHLIRSYGTKECWDVRDGVVEALTKLRTSNEKLCIGVISNFDTRLLTILQELQLRQYFDFVLASYECGCYKPQKEIFNIALKMGNCLPSEAVHIGDDFELDYKASKRAGWNSLLYITNDDLKHYEGNNINYIHDLTGIIEIIKLGLINNSH